MVDAAAAEPSNRDSNPQFEKLVPRTGDTDDGEREMSRSAEPGRMAASSSQSIHPVMVADVIVVAPVDQTVNLHPSAVATVAALGTLAGLTGRVSAFELTSCAVAGGSGRGGPQPLPPSSAAPLTAGS
jgi:hypothetical protein